MVCSIVRLEGDVGKQCKIGRRQIEKLKRCRENVVRSDFFFFIEATKGNKKSKKLRICVSKNTSKKYTEIFRESFLRTHEEKKVKGVEEVCKRKMTLPVLIAPRGQARQWSRGALDGHHCQQSCTLLSGRAAGNASEGDLQ